MRRPAGSNQQFAVDRRTFLSSIAALTALPATAAAEREIRCQIAVIGGGTGGCAAALAALRRGMRVVLTEQTDWIGGQLTAQAVPPDEHRWIEQSGCTRSYRGYRDSVRAFYRAHFPLTAAARARADLNPGNGSVSRLTHEFRVSVVVLEAMFAPYIASGQLTILREHVPTSAWSMGDRITAVSVRDAREKLQRTILADYFLDATELGELLELAHVEHVTGAESHAQSGELHALSEPRPAGSQSFTICFAIDHRQGEDHTIDRPASYRKWREYVPRLSPPWPGRLFSWTACEPRTLAARQADFAPNATRHASGVDLWAYRRIADRANFEPGAYPSDITLVNWPQNDFWLGDLVTADAAARDDLIQQARQLSLSWLYWMQTDAPRPDGGIGWKGLRVRADVVGTEDGLAKAPYIRESRRLLAEFTVGEQHVGAEMRAAVLGKRREAVTAEPFFDAVGVGYYRIDLHPSADGRNYVDIASLPFQIPLGSLLPRRVENLLGACKNIGTTHVTNGCYRLHPVEWNIGEAAGAVAAQAILARHSPRALRNNAKLLSDLQASLRGHGFELEWPPDYRKIPDQS